MYTFYDKDGKKVVLDKDECPEGWFDTPFGRNTEEVNDTQKATVKAKPKKTKKAK